jgi:hypothetical protein
LSSASFDESAAVNIETMPLSAALANHKGAIVKRWSERLLQTYPESATKFLSRERDPFLNPVGHTLHEGLSALFDGLIQPIDMASLTPVLDAIVRIRAVQDFTAGQAIAFPFLLKQIIRAELAADVQRYSEELVILEARIDELALLAFDLFVKCREQVYEVKVNEIRRRAFVLERVYHDELPSS